MADLGIKTRRLTRDKLAQFLNNHELVKAFENLTQDVSQTLPDAISSNRTVSFVVIAPSTDVPNARTLTAGDSLTLDDAGAGGAVTLALTLPESSAVLTGDVSESLGVFTDAPGMSFAVDASASYLVRGVFTLQSDADLPTIGLGFVLPTDASIDGQYGNVVDRTVLGGASGAVDATAAVGGISVLRGEWLVTTANAGTAQLRIMSRVPGVRVTLKALGTGLFVKKI